MERDKDNAQYKKMGEFFCPDCGKIYILPMHGSRLRCRDCAQERNRKERQAHYQRVMAEHRRFKKEAEAKAEEQKAQEEKVLVLSQCKKCHWYRASSGNSDWCCHYYLLKGIGHRRDPGNGPGDCRSFEPKKRRSRKQMADESRKLLEAIEADVHGMLLRKGEKPNE